MTRLEDRLGIMTLESAIEKFENMFPQSSVEKLQLAYKGPFLKYKFIGFDSQNKNSYEFNAHNGSELKNNSRPIKEKEANPERRQAKDLDLSNLIPLTQINNIALEKLPGDNPLQWELDRKRERTIWKVEISEEDGSNLHEIKIDAHDGTIIETKLKS